MAAIVSFHPTRSDMAPARSVLHVVGRVAARVALAVWRAPARIRANRMLAHTLGRMSDHELGDIGLSRQDAVDSTAQPLLAEGGAFLATRVAERRGGRKALHAVGERGRVAGRPRPTGS